MKMYTNEDRDSRSLAILLILSMIGLLMAGFLFHTFPMVSIVLSGLYLMLMTQCFMFGVVLTKFYTLKNLDGKRDD